MPDNITTCYYCGSDQAWWTGSKHICGQQQCMEQALREDSPSFVYPDEPPELTWSTAWWSRWWAV